MALNYNVSNDLVDLIQSTFEGGIGLFLDIGYRINLIPIHDKIEIYLYVPPNGRDTKILHNIKEYGRKNKIPVHLVESLNFNGLQIKDLTDENLAPLALAAMSLGMGVKILVDFMDVCCIFNIQSGVSKDILEEYKRQLETVPYLRRAVILCDETVLRIEKKGSHLDNNKEQAPKQVTQTAIKRNKPIGDEDLVDLKIALETAGDEDVNEFLKRI